MFHKERKYSTRLLCGAAMGALAMFSTVAQAQELAPIEIAPQPLAKALGEFAAQTKRAVLVTPDLTASRTSRGVSGETNPEAALYAMLDGTGLTFRQDGETFLIVKVTADPQSGSAAGDGAEGTVEALIVTAQKREEDIQDVPIAISAFTQEQLTDRQVAGGPDLMTQVPNFTFTKTNFSSYSIQIRGIGTQAISATTDPAVAIAFNNTPFVRNRFFEQEFYDLQRIEVLRGPQGTLYGRNATAGVVNIISAKPSFGYEARLSGDVSNYNSTRLEGMLNLPLVEDAVALRIAGAWTKREGYSTNEITGNPIDGRDLWSTRVSLRFAPSDRLDANLIWEHFEEDDDRLRSGKQLCNTHEVTEVAGFPTTHFQTIYDDGQGGTIFSGIQATFSQGCLPTSLYSPDSFQTPNGIALPYYVPLGAAFLPITGGGLGNIDPYVSRTQSKDLRIIESTVDPGYKAKSDIVELQVSYDLSDTLTVSSETAWASDFIFSTQDFNRFNTAPGAWSMTDGSGPMAVDRNILYVGPNGNGWFCDPQVGCSDRLVAVDLSTAKSKHFSQEFRLASNYEGAFNFSLGANFLRYDTEDKYYVFINSLSLISAMSPFGRPDPVPDYIPGVTDNKECLQSGPFEPDPAQYQSILYCTYIDPNPIENLNDLGHNYFLSRNPYKLISYAVFGEAYYQISDTLKLSGGLRYTVDKKEAPRIPSWLLASHSLGYPVLEVIELEWREPTGRITLDWKPDLAFTDETLLYASFAHGYKAGGSNPPPYGIAIWNGADVVEGIREDSATNPKTFDPEFVNAFEIGAKNTLADGRVTMNLAAFYYDYEGYQISQIVDRSATNLNFDAEVWGLELEADWRPLENLKLGLKLGYENTQVADGERAIDIMDRTAGMPGWVLVRPFPSIPSNCVLPEWLFVGHVFSRPTNPELVNLGTKSGGGSGGCEYAYMLDQDPVTRADYMADPTGMDGGHQGVINYTAYSTDPAMFPGWPEGEPITDRVYPGWNPELDYGANNGQGFFKDLSGNELPNAPNFTATITADYTVPLAADWLMTLHTDLYYQSEAWTRIFNTEGYDKLKAYSNVNLAAIFTNEEAGWKVMAYVKNVMDRDSITGAFLNSDDTGLTTNVFLTEPRLYGIRVTKDWRGGPWWTGANPNHVGPYPITVEIGGQVQRHDAPYDPIQPSFMDAFPDSVDTSRDAQNRDLDWGDGREAKLTWRPTSGPWALSARYRTGETNSNARVADREASECYAKYQEYICEKYLFPNWSETNARNREEFQTIDFTIGRDVGFGGLSRSSVNAGLRYASFESSTSVSIDGSPDNAFPQYTLNNGREYHRYQSILEADREFEGTGPVFAWDAAQDILGSDESGRLAIDWSVGGGVMFGKQTSALTGTEIQSDYESATGFYALFWSLADQVTPTPVSERRSDSATVPLVSGSLGLSYEIQRVRIGAGYRWERYFDVLDTGQGESRTDDRTIDGPYFKLSVGFGG